MFNRGHWLTFFPEFNANLSRYKEMQVRCNRYKKTSTFSPPFCAPLAQGAKILTLIWVRPIYACKILSRSVKVCRSYLRKADFEQMHITMSCICMTAYNYIGTSLEAELSFFCNLQSFNNSKTVTFVSFRKIYQTHFLWSLVIIYFWSGGFAPPCCCAAGATAPVCPLQLRHWLNSHDFSWMWRIHAEFGFDVGFLPTTNLSVTLPYTRDKGTLPWQPILGLNFGI